MDYLGSIHTQNYYFKMPEGVSKTMIIWDKVALMHARPEQLDLSGLEFLSGTKAENNICSLLKGAGRNGKYNKIKKQKQRLGGTEGIK